VTWGYCAAKVVNPARRALEDPYCCADCWSPVWANLTNRSCYSFVNLSRHSRSWAPVWLELTTCRVGGRFVWSEKFVTESLTTPLSRQRRLSRWTDKMLFCGSVAIVRTVFPAAVESTHWTAAVKLSSELRSIESCVVSCTLCLSVLISC